MKKKILEALQTRFEGVSEAILDRIASKLAKTVTEEDKIQDAVDKVTFQQVLDSYGDSRATEAQQTAIKNYEKKHHLKDGKKANGGEPDDEPDNNDDDDDPDIPKWAKIIMKSNKELMEKVRKMEGDTVTKTRKQKLDAILEKLPESHRKGYERMSFDGKTEEEFNALLEEVKGEVDEISKETNVRGAAFGVPASNKAGKGHKGGNVKEASDEDADAVVSKLNL